MDTIVMFNLHKRLTGAALLALFALGLTGCGTASHYKPVPLAVFNQTAAIGQVWENTVGSSINYPSQLAINGQYVAVAGSQGSVSVINTITGKDYWRFKLGADIASGVGFDGKVLAVTTVDNELVALVPTAASGTPGLATATPIAWRQRLASRIYTAPLVAGGRVFVLAGDRSISAFDAQTGVKLWTTMRPSEPLVLSQAGTLGVYKNTLLVGGSGRLLGINPDNGQVAWETSVASTRATNDIERLIDLVGAPNRVGDTVCIRAYQTSVACVDAQKGLVIWSKNTKGAVGVSGDAETVVSSESDGRVKLWNRKTGALVWSVDTLAHRGLSAPLLIGNSIVVGDFEGYVHVINKLDGQFTVRFKTDGSALAAAPVVSGTVVIVATTKGGIFAFSPK
jgi:outer membrane protein assembly factor BamB